MSVMTLNNFLCTKKIIFTWLHIVMWNLSYANPTSPLISFRSIISLRMSTMRVVLCAHEHKLAFGCLLREENVSHNDPHYIITCLTFFLEQQQQQVRRKFLEILRLWRRVREQITTDSHIVTCEGYAREAKEERRVSDRQVRKCRCDC